ncbi:MAG: hypothetical protein K9G67_04475 [Bacteroidales bacterium]|nr:hypothetical protein [Bacteroidales bacterium]MCF8351773.1 hypothetical protein [Bacteroidales bacterium]MCF8375588.1 hypothetical protein [Bacteroidales bacterium]
MKRITYGLLLMVMMTSCTDFIADFGNDDQWVLETSGHIVLHYRQAGFSSAPSPSADEVQEIINNQDFYYRAIQDSLQLDFSDNVLIYLYNKDEAEEAIGTAGGGHSIPAFLSYYYTFIYDIPAYTDQYGIADPYLGAHEMVHVISHHRLGVPGTKVMSEGYAVWLDGGYARHDINDIVIHYRDNEPEKLLNPDQLIYETIDSESVYYPNAGVFLRFLVHSYGIETCNALFTTGMDDFIPHFESLSGVPWEEMSNLYAVYLEGL